MESKWSRLLPKKNQWVIVLLIGILLVIIALPTDSEPQVDTGKHDVSNTVATSEIEAKLKNLLANMQGVGAVQVMITYREEEQVEGIVILAEGAENAVVVRNITEVVQALFQVDAHKIKVIRSNLNN